MYKYMLVCIDNRQRLLFTDLAFPNGALVCTNQIMAKKECHQKASKYS